MARVRDYHREYIRRLDLARERYPDASRSEVTAHARGHRSTADLESALGSGKADFVDVLPGPQVGPRDGTWQWVDVKVEMRDGTKRTYRLRGKQATTKELDKLGRRLDRKGIQVAGLHYLTKRKGKGARAA